MARATRCSDYSVSVTVRRQWLQRSVTLAPACGPARTGPARPHTGTASGWPDPRLRRLGPEPAVGRCLSPLPEPEVVKAEAGRTRDRMSGPACVPVMARPRALPPPRRVSARPHARHSRTPRPLPGASPADPPPRAPPRRTPPPRADNGPAKRLLKRHFSSLTVRAASFFHALCDMNKKLKFAKE